MNITGRQLRMARIALKWRVDDLAHESGVNWAKLQKMERTDDNLEFDDRVQKLINLFRSHKVEFVEENENYHSYIKITK